MPNCPGMLGTYAIRKPPDPPGGCPHAIQKRNVHGTVCEISLFIVGPWRKHCTVTGTGCDRQHSLHALSISVNRFCQARRDGPRETDFDSADSANQCILILHSRGTVEGGPGFQWVDQLAITLETCGQGASKACRSRCNLTLTTLLEVPRKAAVSEVSRSSMPRSTRRFHSGAILQLLVVGTQGRTGLSKSGLVK